MSEPGTLLWEPSPEAIERSSMSRYMRWLEAERPDLVEGYRTLYASKYAPKAYRKRVESVIQDAKCKTQVGGTYEKTR